MRHKLIFIIMIITNIAVSDTFVANPNFEIKYLKDKNVWQLIEQKNGSEKIILESDSSITNLSLSFDKSFIAFQKAGVYNHKIYTKDELKQMELDGAGDQGHKLVILNQKFETVKEIPDVRVYHWSPISNEMVMITGTNIESGLGFISEQVQIINIDDNSRIFLSEKPSDVFWAKHDDNIYMDYETKYVKKYNPDTNELTDTDYHGIYFSPTGDYYYSPTIEGTYFELYNTKSNEPIKEQYPAINEKYLWPHGWLEDSNIFVKDETKSKHSTLINVDTGKVITIDTKPHSKVGSYVPKDAFGEISETELQEKIESIK